MHSSRKSVPRSVWNSIFLTSCSLVEFAKILPAVECEDIGVVAIARTVLVVFPRGAAGGDDVVALELPVHVLESVLHGVRVMQKNTANVPVD